MLWDEAQQRLFAARDRFGIKPLFFARHEGALYLASEVKALFAAGVPARWGREGLFNATLSGDNPTETLFEGVSQVPPGTLPARRAERNTDPPLLGFRLPAGRPIRPRRARTKSGPRSFRRSWTTPFGFGCGPTCPSGVI